MLPAAAAFCPAGALVLAIGKLALLIGKLGLAAAALTTALDGAWKDGLAHGLATLALHLVRALG